MMNGRILHLEQCVPVALVADGALIARDGALTVGWELFPAEEHTVDADHYDSIIRRSASALRALPPWTMVHRQDVYIPSECHLPRSGAFLADRYAEHFEGRPYLSHRQFIWFTFNPSIPGRSGAMKGALGGAATGIRYRTPPLDDLESTLARIVQAASECVASISGEDSLAPRRMETEDLEGIPGGDDGILEEYLRWFGGKGSGTDITLSGGTYLDRDSRRLFSHSFSRTDDLPGEVVSTLPVRALSGPSGEVVVSGGAPLGGGLRFPHMVNCYWLIPDREHALRELDRRRRAMSAMSKGSAENSVHAEGIARFIEMIHAESTAAVYTHLNVISWGERSDEPRLRGEVGAALAGMGLTGRLNTLDTPSLWIAALPGAEMELGGDNLMLAELTQALCLGVGESFQRGVPGGLLRICDRTRRVPVPLDTQQLAYDARWIENYNAFIMGPSGSGKSFFTAWYVRSCFDAGEHVFIIDKGGSYEGLCALIREETGGRDGAYHTWTPEEPFSFAPFEGCRGWASERDPYGGTAFLVSLLRIIWTPPGGWNSVTDSVVYRILGDFIAALAPDAPDPLFGDFVDYLRDVVLPRVSGEGEPLLVGGVPVTAAHFDAASLCVALDPYGRDGRFSYLLNARGGADLVSSRFVVFELDAVADTDPTLYALCTFCIIHAFGRKMRSDSDAFRLLFIEEAWQAIASEATADYLRGLWKTARKYHTSATVVTQQLSDITGSEVIKDAILSNSPVKILLDQRSNAAALGELSTLLGLSPVEMALVGSIGRDLPADAPWREVFISLGGRRFGVYALEVSPEEALVYESDKVRKRPLFALARERGSIIAAASELAAKQKAGR